MDPGYFPPPEEAPKICLACGRESPPFSGACIWCGAPFPQFLLLVPPAPLPPVAEEVPPPAAIEVPPPPRFRLARAGGVLGLASGAGSVLLAAAFALAPAGAPAAGIAAGLAGAALLSSVLAFRKRHWRPAVALGCLGAAAGLLWVVGFLLSLGSVALLGAARDEFLT